MRPTFLCHFPKKIPRRHAIPNRNLQPSTCVTCAPSELFNNVARTRALSLWFFRYVKLSVSPCRRARVGMRGRMQKSIGICVADASTHARMSQTCTRQVVGTELDERWCGDLLRCRLWCCAVLGESLAVLTRLIRSVARLIVTND